MARVRTLVLLAAALLVPLLALVLALSTTAGQELLARRLVAVLDATFAGSFRVERVAVSPAGITALGVEIADPAGRKLAEVEELRASPSLSPALLRGDVHLSSASLAGVRLIVDGGALVAAFTPREPSPPSSGPSRTRITLDALHVERADVALPGVALVRDLALETRLAVDGEGVALRGVATGNLLAPLPGPARLELEGSLAGGFRALDVTALQASLGGSRLSAVVSGDLAELRLAARDVMATLDPATARALGLELAAPLDVSGTAALEAGLVTADLEAAPRGGGSAHVKGTLALAGAAPSLRADVEARALSLRALSASLPPIVATGRVRITGTAAAGRAELELAPLALGAAEIPSLKGAAIWDGAGAARSLRLEGMELEMPGGRLAGSGAISARRLELDGDLTVGDAAALGSALPPALAALGVELPDPRLAGSFRAHVTASGPPASPRVRAELDATRLAAAGVEAAQLAARVDLAGLPDAPRGEVEARAGSLVVGGQRFSAVSTRLALRRGRAEGSVSGTGRFGPLTAELGADVGPAFAFLRFDRLELGWPRGRLALGEPARLDLGEAPRVDHLELAGPQGGVVLAGTLGPELDLAITTSRLDLAALPRELVPEALGLVGRLDLEAHVQGSAAAPRGEARLSWTAGAVRGVSGLEVSAALQAGAKDARLTLAVKRGEASVDLRAAGAWPPDPEAPLSIEGTLRALDLAGAAQALGIEEPLAGTVHAEARIAGTARRPEGRVSVDGEGLSLRGIAGLDVDAALDLTVSEARLVGTAAWQGASARADVTAAVRGGEVLASASPASLLAASLEGTVSVTGLPLSALGLESRAAVDATAELRGSPEGPRGEGTLRLVDPGGIEGELRVVAGDAATSAAIEATLAGAPLLEGEVELAAPPERLARRLRTAALKADLTARGVDLRRLAKALDLDAIAAGHLDATLEARGTLDTPEGTLQARVPDLAVADARGSAQLDASWIRGEARARVLLDNAAGGTALLTASAAVPGVAALPKARGTMRLLATDLDLSFASGLLRDLRTVRGRLDADLTGEGLLAELPLRGTARVRDGIVSYTGFGEIRDVAAALALEPGRVALTKLTARSSGTLTASGEAVRPVPGGSWAVTGKLGARGFGLVSSDLLRAYLTADGRFDGAIERGKLKEATLRVKRARVELPETPSRDIQSLEDRDDFVIVRAGGVHEAPAREPGASVHDDILASLSIVAPDVEVRGVDMSVNADVDMGATVRRSGIELRHGATVKSGYVVVLGRRFELKPRGRVRYVQGDLAADPHLDVEATYASSHATVNVKVTGTAQRPITRMSSVPVMSEAEIVTLLATGRPALERGAGGNLAGGSGAASAIGAVAASQLRKDLAARLPVVIGIEAGEGTGTYAVEAGRYVSDRVYVGYTHEFRGLMGGESSPSTTRNQNELRLEYQISPQWTTEATFGDAEKGSLDVLWSRDW